MKKDTKTCCFCGDEAVTFTRPNGQTLCADCYERYEVLHFCADCGVKIIGDAAGENAAGEMICTICDEYYYHCDHCDDVTRRDELISVDGGDESVCEDCANSQYYYRCDHCGDYVSRGNLWIDRNMTICDNCSDDYYTCDDCGNVIHRDDSHYIDGNDYCGDCAASHRNYIRDYDYKPTPIFYGGNATGYYGLELEIDDGDDRREAARRIQDDGGNCIYLKHDGSLSSDGFEIVTHPATLEYHMLSMPWRDIIRAAREYNYTSHDAETCGLHIHASRTLFGGDKTIQDLNIAKTMLLIDFWWEQYIVPFSRRDYDQLNDWAKKPNTRILPTDNAPQAINKARQSGEYDRYKAVNLRNRHTVEFRFFRGTLRRGTIIASIQFIDTLIKYVSGVELGELWSKNWNDVFGDTQHAELKDYLQKRRLLDNTEEI